MDGKFTVAVSQPSLHNSQGVKTGRGEICKGRQHQESEIYIAFIRRSLKKVLSVPTFRQNNNDNNQEREEIFKNIFVRFRVEKKRIS